ncbi:MAG TPA: DUF1501 domain-containing protein [Pirellulaceae bacterium]|nr:DUF1501 domain-containing protein [Pirellulaceae bacterium]
MLSLSRRHFWEACGASLLGLSAAGFLPALASEVATAPTRRRQCILLWMTGGPSQLDTFDLKPGHANGGEFKEISTNVPGLKFSEHLPKLARQADRLAIIRGMSTKEGDHGRGTYLLHTGHQPMGPVRYPSIGASLARELGGTDSTMPHYLSIGPYRAFSPAAFGAGFLGPKFAPLTVGAQDTFAQPAADGANDGYAELRVDDLALPANVAAVRQAGRLDLWRSLERKFGADHRTASALTHQTVYERAVSLMSSDVAKAFDLSQEKVATRDAYGKSRFGQGCLMARRLIERGVAFVEVSLGGIDGNGLGWDTHQNNFTQVKSLSAALDAGWSSLMSDLEERGLLETTTIIWMGEFGRTPIINGNGGRDHYPAAWTTVLAGGGIRGGQAYGSTTTDGLKVAENPVDVDALLATLCAALGVAGDKQVISDIGRPIRIAEGQPIKAVLT